MINHQNFNHSPSPPSLTPQHFNYDLPDNLIAHQPTHRRDMSRLLVFNRLTKQITHLHFSDLPSLLSPDYLIVRNNTKVFPARIFGKKNTGGNVEVLLTKPLERNSFQWECLVKSKLKPDQIIQFPHGLLAKLESRISDSPLVILTFNQEEKTLLSTLDKIGHVPLPPYIHNTQTKSTVKNRYQTYFAKNTGSVAAPTAGLHFTSTIDQALKANGVEVAELTLHVGYGTFAPLKETNFENKRLHSEFFQIPQTTADQIKKAKVEHKKIVCIGTTTTRVLESSWDNTKCDFSTLNGSTDLFICPPHQFQLVDSLLTNFHLPKSSLLSLITAFTTKPQTNESFTTFSDSIIGTVYQEAINQKYRFFSFGDAMLIL